MATNYNEQLTQNNTKLDALKQTIDGLPDYVAPKPETRGSATYTTNGAKTLAPPSGGVFSGVDITVNVPGPKPEQEKTVTPSKTSQVVIPDTGKTLSKVTVNSIPTQYRDTSDATATTAEVFAGKTAYLTDGKYSGTFTLQQELATQKNQITALQNALNGKFGSGGGSQSPNIQPITITENGTITAPAGTDGYSPITVDVSGGGGGGCGNWSKVEVESWTPAENTQQYNLPKDVAGMLDCIIITRPYAGSVKDEVISLFYTDILNAYAVGPIVYRDNGPHSYVFSCQYVEFLGFIDIGLDGSFPYTFIGGQTYTVTKCYK